MQAAAGERRREVSTEFKYYENGSVHFVKEIPSNAEYQDWNT